MEIKDRLDRRDLEETPVRRDPTGYKDRLAPLEWMARGVRLDRRVLLGSR